jgi:hypothetical protein
LETVACSLSHQDRELGLHREESPLLTFWLSAAEEEAVLIPARAAAAADTLRDLLT